MIVTIQLQINTDTNQVGVMAPMQDDDQKKFTIRNLLTAIALVMDYKPTPIITPGKVRPMTPNGVPPMPPRLQK